MPKVDVNTSPIDANERPPENPPLIDDQDSGVQPDVVPNAVLPDRESGDIIVDSTFESVQVSTPNGTCGTINAQEHAFQIFKE